MKFLSNADYEAMARQGLRQHMLSEEQIASLLAARWPMTAMDLIAEANGRFLIVTLDDIEAFVTAEAGEDVPIDRVLFMPAIAERFLQWAVDTGRARLSPNGERHQEDPDLVRTISRFDKFAGN